MQAEPEEIAENVLLPGNPARARYVAEAFFEGARKVTDKRSLVGFTGTSEGMPVTVQTTGIGAPSAAIIVEELIRLGAKNILRVGSCGGYHPDMRFGDLVIATAAVPMVGVVGQLTGGRPHAPTSHPDLLVAARRSAEEMSVRHFSGPVVSTDLFYDPDPRPQETWRSTGAIAVEMEAAAVFTLAAMRGIRAGCLLMVDTLWRQDEHSSISEAEEEHATDRMIGIALDALRSLDA